jgi:hypothetical protein
MLLNFLQASFLGIEERGVDLVFFNNPFHNIHPIYGVLVLRNRRSISS